MFLKLAFLFFIGSTLGWVLEVFYRRFFSKANKERKWINPGFCVGPYVPLYGFGLCLLYLIASLEKYTPFENEWLDKIMLFAFMALCMTLIEYIAGILSLKVMHVRLWDYTKEWGNIQGLICPKFSFYWGVISALYYFFINPYILDALEWLSNNLAFSFVIGLFFGVFIIDMCYSAKLLAKLKKFADENGVTVKVENLRYSIKEAREKANQRKHFFLSLLTDNPLSEFLKEQKEKFIEEKQKFNEAKNNKTGK